MDALYEKRRDKSVPRGKFAPLATISLRDLRETLDREIAEGNAARKVIRAPYL